MVHLKTTKATNVTNIKMCHKKITSFIKNGFLKDWLFLKNLLLLKNLPGSQNCFIVLETETQF